MEIKYSISEKEYAKYLKASFEKKAKQPLNMFFTLVFTALPLAVFFICLKEKLFSGPALWGLGAAALLLSAANFYMRTKYWKSSASAPAMVKEQRKLGPDFWKQHALSFSEEGVALKSGSYSTEYDWQSFGGFEESGDMLIPIFNAVPLDLIPEKKLNVWGGKEKFRKDVLNLAKAGIKKGFAEKKAEAENSEHICTLNYSYDKESYLKNLVDSYRKRYTTKLICTKANGAKLSIIAVLAYLLATAEAASLKILYAGLIIILAYEHISVFTPILKGRLERALRPVLALEPEQEAALYLDRDKIIIIGDVHYIEMPLSDVAGLKNIKGAAAIYLANGSIIPVPCPEGQEKEFEFFCKRVRASV